MKTELKGKTVEKFMEELTKRGLSERRKKKYFQVLKQFLNIELRELNKKSVDEFFLKIKSGNYCDETKEDYWNIFRIFVRWLKPKIDLTKYKLQLQHKRKLPEEILSVEEVAKMIMHTKTVRDRAILTLLYDSGCRPSELLNLKLKDLTIEDSSLVVTFNGKTGMRKIPIITTLNSIKFLKEWLLIHEGRENPEEYLFNESKTIERLNQIVKECAQKAGIKKRVYSYIMRHSRATFLAKLLTEQELKVYMGWNMASKMVEVYVHLSGRDLQPKVAELNKVNNRDGIRMQSGIQESIQNNNLEGNIIQTLINLSQEVNSLKKRIEEKEVV
jgi:integrase